MKHCNGQSNLSIVKSYLAGERPLTVVGYTAPIEEKHEIGDKWTDSSGKHWEQTAGGPSRQTPVMDIIRAELNDICSCCGAEIRWGDRYDRKFYHKTGKCFNCLIQEETQLRIKGKYKLYEQKKVFQNQRSYLLDIRKKLREAFDYTKEHTEITFVNSNGFVESWENNARDDLLSGLKKDFVKCLKTIKEVESAIVDIDKQINSTING